MPFYVPVGPRGLVFRAGAIWTGDGVPVLLVDEPPRPCGSCPAAFAGRFRSVKQSTFALASGRPYPSNRQKVSDFSGIPAMITTSPTGDESDRIRRRAWTWAPIWR